MALSVFLISLIVISALLVGIIVFLLVTSRGNVGKRILNMMKEKKSFEEILIYGQKKKWKEREIKLYYLLYTTQDFQKNGYNLDEIENMALDSGWPRDLVQIVISKVK